MRKQRGNRVVILGAGFGGLNLAMELAKRRGHGHGHEIVLVDRHNFHLFTPILYQVATGLVEPGHIAYPVRVLARQYGFTFQESFVQGVDLGRRRVHTDDGAVDYDRLVLALGSVTNFFGMDEVRQNSLTLKTLGDAVRIRNQLVDAFERADVADDPEERRKWLTVVIVGGGATGAELIGSVRTAVDQALLPSFPSVRPEEVRLIMVEAMGGILGGLDPDLARLATSCLQGRGIEMRLNTAVTHVDGNGVSTKSGDFIPAGTVIWAAGVRAAPLAESLQVEKARGGRILVDERLGVPDQDGLYALGDIASFTDPWTDQVLPPNAAVALRQGRYLGRTLAAEMEGSSTRPFRYRPVGELVALGRNQAVADIYGLKLDGFPAWAVWRSFYLSQLMGFKNRLAVLLDWSYAYFGRRDLTRLSIATEYATETEELIGQRERRSTRRAAS